MAENKIMEVSPTTIHVPVEILLHAGAIAQYTMTHGETMNPLLKIAVGDFCALILISSLNNQQRPAQESAPTSVDNVTTGAVLVTDNNTNGDNFGDFGFSSDNAHTGVVVSDYTTTTAAAIDSTTTTAAAIDDTTRSINMAGGVRIASFAHKYCNNLLSLGSHPDCLAARLPATVSKTTVYSKSWKIKRLLSADPASKKNPGLF